MAAKPRRKPRPRPHAAPSAWEQFAAMSRSAIGPAPRRAAKRVKRHGAPRVAAAAAKGTRSASQATAQALKLGRRQAEWVVLQRAPLRAARAKVVASAKAADAKRVRGAKGTAKKAPARKTVARRARAAAPPAGAPASAPAGSRGVLVAEGDSWFDYPFYDVLKRLDDEFGWDIETVAHRGDSVESMAYDGGQLADFVHAIERVVRRGDVPHAILVSGGGNDVAGDGFAMLLNHRSSPVYGLNAAIVDGVLQTRIRVAYTTMLSAVTAACDRLLGLRVPILLHGYDYPVPDGRGFLGGWGPLPGPWLEPGFREKGYASLPERVAIARELIDRFYTMLRDVVATPAFAHVTLVDLRNTLSTDLANQRYKDWWGNELHPTLPGFRKVAALFDAKL